MLRKLLEALNTQLVLYSWFSWSCWRRSAACLHGFRKYWRSINLQKIWSWLVCVLNMSEEPRRPGLVLVAAWRRHLLNTEHDPFSVGTSVGTQGNWSRVLGLSALKGSLTGGSSAHLPAVSQKFQAWESLSRERTVPPGNGESCQGEQSISINRLGFYWAPHLLFMDKDMWWGWGWF